VLKYALAILLFFLPAWDAQSQTVLTLDQCLSMAREHNPRLKKVQNAARATELSHSELTTTGLPQVRIQATPFYAPYSRSFGYDPTTTDGGQLAGQIVVQQSLYDGGLRSLRSDQIRVDLERTAKEYKVADRDLAYSVKQAFIEVLRSNREAQLEGESVSQLGDYLSLVKQLFNGGTASYTDVLKTRLQLTNATLAYQKAMDDRSIAKYSLAELIGSDIDTSFDVDGSLDMSSRNSVDSLLAMGNPDRVHPIELSIADLEVKSSALDVEMTQHESWPVISLSADAGYLSSGANLKLAPPDRESAVGFGVGIVVDIPLINWGATDLRVQQRQLAVDNVRLESGQIRRSITSDLKKTTLQLARMQDRLQSIRQSLHSAEENFLLTKSKFAGGGTLSIEVLSAQQLLTETKLSELESMAQIQNLAAKLEQLTMQ
jgi:outer membrane protein TolC